MLFRSLSDGHQNNFRMDKSEQVKSRFINYDSKTKFIIDKPEQLQHKLVTDRTQSNLKIDKLEKKYIAIIETKRANSEIRDDFNIISKPKYKKNQNDIKEKNKLFNDSKIDFKSVNHRETLLGEFSMEISEKGKNKFSMDVYQEENVKGKEKSQNELMATSFSGDDKMSKRKKNNLKIEVL